METLSHDPKTKGQIKEGLYAFLYGPVLKEFKARLDVLIIQNALITHSQHQSFIYKGEFYSCDASPPPRRTVRLSRQLHEAMDAYLSDVKEISHVEMPFVIGYINQVLNVSNELQDYLRLLPDSVHFPITEMIRNCPCRLPKLKETDITQLQKKNEGAIHLMKRRLLCNLLL